MGIVFKETPIPRQSFRTRYKNGKNFIYDAQSDKLIELRTKAWTQLPQVYKIWSKENPVIVLVETIFQIPIRWNNSQKKIAEQGLKPHTSVPDCDNMAKLYMDVIKGIVFEDDSQVTTMVVCKSYGIEPLVRITCGILGILEEN